MKKKSKEFGDILEELYCYCVDNKLNDIQWEAFFDTIKLIILEVFKGSIIIFDRNDK